MTKHMLVGIVLLAAVGFAAADINFSVTRASDYDALPTMKLEYGATHFNFDFQGLDPLGTPTGPHDLGPGSAGESDVFYVWAEFDNEPTYAGCVGLQLQAYTLGDLQIYESVVYRHALLVKGVQYHVRWGNDDPIGMHGGASGIAVGDMGMTPAASGYGEPYGALNVDLGDWEWDTTGRKKSLVGAIYAGAAGPGAGELYLGLGTTGLVNSEDFRQWDSPQYLPNVYIEGVKAQDYSTDLGQTPTEAVYALAAFCTPEPTTVLLLATLGLVIRRR